MKRFMTILPLLTLTVSGCALMSSTPAANTSASTNGYEVMSSTPPPTVKEEQPRLDEKRCPSTEPRVGKEDTVRRAGLALPVREQRKREPKLVRERAV